jgi:hypothetical protein
MIAKLTEDSQRDLLRGIDWFERISPGRRNTGVVHVTVWYRSTPEEAVGFELSE